MKILVTGSTGFIGAALTFNLLNRGYEVLGIDNHNEYYDPQLKEDRLKLFISNKNYQHHRFDIKERLKLDEFFNDHRPQRVVNLAAQAGVRYSMKDPYSYIDSNLLGFGNILECCRKFDIEAPAYCKRSTLLLLSLLPSTRVRAMLHACQLRGHLRGQKRETMAPTATEPCEGSTAAHGYRAIRGLEGSHGNRAMRGQAAGGSSEASTAAFCHGATARAPRRSRRAGRPR